MSDRAEEEKTKRYVKCVTCHLIEVYHSREFVFSQCTDVV